MRGLGSLAIEMLQEIVRSEFDLFVAPLRRPILASDQARSVNSSKVSVDESVSALGVFARTFRESEVPLGVFIP